MAKGVIDANDINTNDKFLPGVGDTGPQICRLWQRVKEQKILATLSLKTRQKTLLRVEEQWTSRQTNNLRSLFAVAGHCCTVPPLHGANIQKDTKL